MRYLPLLCCLVSCCVSFGSLRASALVALDSLPASATVYLVDGSQQTGLLLRRTATNGAVLYMADGSLLEYAARDIARVRLTAAPDTPPEAGRPSDSTSASVAPSRSTAHDPDDERFQPRLRPARDFRPLLTDLNVWNWRADLHSLSGASKTVGFNLTVGAHLKLLRRLNPDLLLGAGIGWDLYAPGSGEKTYPIYATAHYYPNIAQRQLYMFANAGYGLAFTDELLQVYEAEGGPMVHAGIGIHLFSRSGHRLGVEIGYKAQEARFARINSNMDFEVRDLRYQRITLGVWAYIFRNRREK